MTPDLDQLVSDVAALAGVAKPAWLEEDAPVLGADEGTPAGGFYLIGLIGGKDVGKSALVNALVGHEITARTSHGPGTETVIAYAHASQTVPLRALLEREVPGRYTIVAHELPRLTRQVLLDLPDVDSVWGDHLVVTRRMLRHMLFPIWMQSIEKYADRQPQELLAKVAAGNAPANFVFCLNKVDQLEKQSGPAAIDELREDYAARLARVVGLAAPPRVFAICALQPARFDLPELKDVLAQQKSEDAVRDSKAKAALQQRASVLEWLTAQDLPARAARLARLQADAEEFVNDRLGTPLIDTVLPRLTDDPLYRQAVVDDCMAKRVARWPVVNVLHALFSVVGGFIRRNAEPAPRAPGARAGESLVDQQLVGLTTPSAAGPPAVGRTLAELVQTTFALLQQSHPTVSGLFAGRRLWEPMCAAGAATELRDALVATVDRQRADACARADHDGGPWPLLRGLLTIGALVWFPIVQPVLVPLLTSTTQPGYHESFAVTLVRMLSLDRLISAIVELVIYFSLIWLVLRWDTQRRVARQFSRWKRLDDPDPTLNLTRRTLDWMSALVDPVRAAREATDRLAARVEELRRSVEASR